jgi:hypothetical protein
MKHLFIILTILTLSCQVYSQEENKSTLSVGILGSNWGYDYGGYIAYHFNKHAIRFHTQYANRVYRIETRGIQPGITEGYGVGGSYIYRLSQKKIYQPSIQLQYQYRYIEGTCFEQSFHAYTLQYDAEYIVHECNLGYVNSFNFKNIELQITPGISWFYHVLYGFNAIAIEDYENRYSPDNDVIEALNGWGWRISLEMSVGYRF